MEARLTPKSLSGHEARFILERIRTMIATKDATMQAVSRLGHSMTPATSTLDDLAALEAIEEIITSSSDASACGIIPSCGVPIDSESIKENRFTHFPWQESEPVSSAVSPRFLRKGRRQAP